MNEETRRWLEIGALQLAVIVAATHLYAGLPRLVQQPTYATFTDPRPALFVLSAMAIFAGVIYVAVGGRRTPVYALGIALMAAFVVGYVWWHLTGHVGGLPWVEAERTVYHDRGPVSTIVYHLRTDRLELVSKLAETALAALLAVLLVDARRSTAGAGADDAGSSAGVGSTDDAGSTDGVGSTDSDGSDDGADVGGADVSGADLDGGTDSDDD